MQCAQTVKCLDIFNDGICLISNLKQHLVFGVTVQSQDTCNYAKICFFSS